MNKIKKTFFLIYKIDLNFEKENNKQSPIVINNAKNERFREKFKNILPLIFETRTKNSKDFQNTAKKFKNNENYKFYHPLIERHFLYKAV